MFEQRSILYLTNYRFKNNNVQNVYLLILEVLENNLICLVKTSTKQYISDSDIESGCIKKGNSRAYYMSSSRIVGESNYSFPDHTFIYFNSTIKHKVIPEIETNCAKIDLLDKMLKNVFVDIIYCSIHSGHLKPHILERFEKYLEDEFSN